MPYNDPAPTDPMTLTGVELWVDDSNAVLDMAACFVEEYVRVGLSAEAIFELFEDGKYAGPALAIGRLGNQAIRDLIQQQIKLRGPRGVRTKVDQTQGGSWSLPVLES